MKFNPMTKSLYTDDNKLIKKMHCPYISLRWNDLSSVDGSMDRFCAICESSVVKTKDMIDKSLLALLQKNPETCLKIDWNQENVIFNLIKTIKKFLGDKSDCDGCDFNFNYSLKNILDKRHDIRSQSL